MVSSFNPQCIKITSYRQNCYKNWVLNNMGSSPKDQFQINHPFNPKMSKMPRINLATIKNEYKLRTWVFNNRKKAKTRAKPRVGLLASRRQSCEQTESSSKLSDSLKSPPSGVPTCFSEFPDSLMNSPNKAWPGTARLQMPVNRKPEPNVQIPINNLFTGVSSPSTVKKESINFANFWNMAQGAMAQRKVKTRRQVRVENPESAMRKLKIRKSRDQQNPQYLQTYKAGDLFTKPKPRLANNSPKKGTNILVSFRLKSNCSIGRLQYEWNSRPK